MLAQNGRLATATRSTTFGTGTPKTELDWIILRARQLPGPGAYVSNLGTIARRAAPNKTLANSRTAALSYTPSLADETGKLSPNTFLSFLVFTKLSIPHSGKAAHAVTKGRSDAREHHVQPSR